jgi:hypothetical protein
MTGLEEVLRSFSTKPRAISTKRGEYVSRAPCATKNGGASVRTYASGEEAAPCP